MEVTVNIELNAYEIREAIMEGNYSLDDIIDDDIIEDYVVNNNSMLENIIQNMNIEDLCDDEDIKNYCQEKFEITEVYSKDQIEERVVNDSQLQNSIVNYYLKHKSIFDITTTINSTISRESKLMIIKLLLDNNDKDFAGDVLNLSFKNYEQYVQEKV